jgi:tricorn protease
VWTSNDAIAFLSDRDGVSNVWAYDTKAKKLAQLTTFSDYDVKALDASFDGSTMVFEQAGYVHMLDTKSGKSHVVNINATGDFPWMMAQWKDVSASMSNLTLSPTGKRVAVEARGEIYTIPADKGDVRNLTNSTASAEHEPAWSPDGKSLSYFSDRSGEYALYIQSQDGLTPAREIKIPTKGHFYTAAWSPDGKRIMFHDTNLKLWVVDVATGQAKIVGSDPWMVPTRTMNPCVVAGRQVDRLHQASEFSIQSDRSRERRDGRVEAGDGRTRRRDDAGVGRERQSTCGSSRRRISRSGRSGSTCRTQITRRTSRCTRRCFAKTDPSPFLRRAMKRDGGRWMRERGTSVVVVEAVVEMRLGPTARLVARMPPLPPPRPASLCNNRLRRSTTSHSRGARNRRAPIHKSSRRRSRNGLLPRASGRWRRWTRRCGRWSDASALFAPRQTRHVIHHRRHRLRHQSRRSQARLPRRWRWRWTWRSRRRSDRGGPAVFVVDADRQAPAAGSGRVNADLRAYVDFKQEFKQIFDEAWRNQRDYLYVTNEHGADWPKMKEMYGALLPFVNHRADLNYLIDQMGAEVAVGHSYVRGGDMPDVPAAVPGGLLGADFSIENGRYRITKIYDDEQWNPDLRAPLAEPGVDVRVGDYILAINGQDLKAPGQHLSFARRHREQADEHRRQQHARDRRRATRNRRSRGERTDTAHARVGRAQSARRRLAVAGKTRVCLSAEYRWPGIHELQSLLLRAAGQAGGRD